MPALSPTMEEGKLVKWHVGEGDRVGSGDIIAEIETDKATMEVEAVDEGRIGKILVAEGTEHVPVNEPIALLVTEDEGEEPLDSSASSPAEAPPSQAEDLASFATMPSRPAGESDASGAGLSHGREGEGARARAAEANGQAERAEMGSATRLFASPLARRLARERGLD